MAIVGALAAPTYFITFTCNPKWPEIVSELFPGQQACDRPDLASRVFQLKLTELFHDLKTKQIFGPVLGIVHVIEFQKRGLPHAHILVIVEPDHRPQCASDLDSYISAEIPDPTTHPEAYETVKNSMMHGPCGNLNKSSPCMEDGHCTKHYPMAFTETTTFGPNGFPEYRRRNDGRTISTEKYGELDNRWVVPHNLYLAAKYGAHINVECCTSSAAILYLFKYIYKGPTRATIFVSNQGLPETQQPRTVEGQQQHPQQLVANEINDFVDGRYIAPCEAVWRIFGFKMQSHYPCVVRLQLHLPGGLMHIFKDDETLEEIAARAQDEISTLTQYFKYNTDHPDDPPSTYVMFPRTHVYNKKLKKWTVRTKGEAIGRLYFIQPSAGELFYLRMLLLQVESPKSFPDLRTFNGVVEDTFKNSCRSRGLLDDDDEWRDCLESASKTDSGYQLRNLFVQILLYCSPTNPEDLWLQFQDLLSYDLDPKHRRAKTEEDVRSFAIQRGNKALSIIDHMLQSRGKSLSDFDILQDISTERENGTNLLIAKELSYPRLHGEGIARIVHQLNADQRRAYDSIIQCYHANTPKVFFIDGPAGTGKTFLYSAVLSTVRSKGHIALAVASSGIAALLLQGGQTAHSRFKVPIPTLEDSTCTFPEDLAKLITEARMIVWDEAPMTHRRVFECVDRSLKDLMKKQDPRNEKQLFGGKIVVLGGDFRQIPPVIRRGYREETVASSIKRSSIWREIIPIKLTINMRLLRNSRTSDFDETDFAKWLLSVGEGSIEGISSDHGIHTQIQLLSDIVMNPGSTVQELINRIYPDLSKRVHDFISDPRSNELAIFLSDRMIMCTKNDEVHWINTMITDSIPTTTWHLDSSDTIIDDNSSQGFTGIISPEFLHGLDSSSLPPHRLTLKVGCPVIMLRNMSPDDGLCNGTRLIVTHISRFNITATIINGPFAGNNHHIPRIPNCTTDLDVPFKLCRRQFPLRPAFAMTVNKSQGQTLQCAGLYLKTPVFSHGQLYVALSRTTTRKSLHVLLEENNSASYGKTINVVYPEILA